jgi:hypothetical protein
MCPPYSGRARPGPHQRFLHQIVGQIAAPAKPAGKGAQMRDRAGQLFLEGCGIRWRSEAPVAGAFSGSGIAVIQPAEQLGEGIGQGSSTTVSYMARSASVRLAATSGATVSSDGEGRIDIARRGPSCEGS